MAKPKLALIPAAQGTSLYSVLPSSGVGDFDFTRDTIATRINSQGLIETVADGVSRLNYPLIDGKVVGCPSHLLEPQRTNLVLESNNFDNYFSKPASSSVQSNQIISPDGTQNADKVIKGTADLALRRSGQVTIGTENTFSIYVKKGTSSSVRLDIGDEGIKTFYLTDYWQRISVTATPSTYGHIDIEMPNANQGDYIYVFGAQVEQGSYPTSYIPTNASAVTRSAETATNSGDASTFNDSEGVLMVEATFKQLSHNNLITLTNGQVGNIIQLFANTNDKKELRFYLSFGGTNIAPSTIVAINEIEEYNKISIKYKSGSTKVYINGFLKLNITTAFNGASFDRLHLSQYNESLPFVGSIKQIQYFDSALNDSDLETLTSWVSFSDMAEGQLYSIE